MTEIANATPTLTPHIVCAGAADAIEFYKNAFGAEDLMRIPLRAAAQDAMCGQAAEPTPAA